MKCPTCGAANRAESRFCLSCGTRIELPDAVPSPVPLASSSGPSTRRPLVIAAGVIGAVAVLLVGGLLVLGSGGDSENTSPPSRTAADNADDGEQDVAETPLTSAPAPPAASITPTTSPATSPPAATVEPTTAPTTVLAPAPPAPVPEGFPFPNAFEVPQLGVEPVRGTGCGADGSIGDVVPDGWWFGGVEDVTSASLLLDLGCVYFGAEAGVRIADCAATEDYEICTAYWGENFWPVNNTERYRVVPAAPDLVRTVDSAMGCSLADVDRFERDELTWVHIVGGRAVHLQHLCPGG